MLFKEVLGQETLKKHLLQTVKDGRIPHAQLFLGPEGCGNLALAFAYAQYICCAARKEDDSCGVCPSCNKYNKLIHPDLHFTYPTVGAKELSTNVIAQWREAFLENPYMDVQEWIANISEENKQGNITVEECRDIIRKLSMKPFESEFKVLIMWRPEYLRETGNTLLKIIEEPAQKTLFLFVAHDDNQILGTILSRTQMVKASRLSDEEIAEGLVKLFSVPAEQALSIARMSEGNFNAARRMVHEHSTDFLDNYRKWFNSCIKNQGREMIAWIDSYAGSGREVLKSFLGYGLHFIRETMLMKYGDYSEGRLPAEEVTFISSLGRFLQPASVDALYNDFNDAIYHIERNANPKIILINLSLSIKKLLLKS
jgi:DNA polymerase-3 subunit delta'